MSTYSVEMNINETILVEADDRDEAEAIAHTEMIEGFDIEPHQITTFLIKELN